MRLSISTISSPLQSIEDRMRDRMSAKLAAKPPSLSHLRRDSMTGLGSVGALGRRRLLPRLAPTIHLQYGGDPVNQLYAARAGNKYNPDPFARQVIAAQRALASRYSNPEFRAFPGSTAMFPYAEGGEAPDEGAPDDGADEKGADIAELMAGDDQDAGPAADQERQIVIEAMLALEGRHPDPEVAIKRFVDTFGEQALAELASLMKQRGDDEEEEGDEEDPAGPEGSEEPDLATADQGAPDQGPPPAESGEEEEPPLAAQAGGGLLRGPGSGQSDEIEGTTPSGRPVLLSDGEYVIDAPTVAALGDGSTDAGARRLDEFRKKVRTNAYGHDKQAKPMKNGGRTIMVEFGG